MEPDTFIVGDGSYKLMEKMKKRNNFSSQLVGISDASMLKTGIIDAPLVISENDLHRFSPISEVPYVADYEEVFFACKKDAYSIFSYLKVKSSRMGDEPVSEKNLIVTRRDKDLISYLKASDIVDYWSVEKLAIISAYMDMGVDRVVFLQRDNCPVCRAHDKLILNIQELYQSLLDGNGFPHPLADFKIIPMICRDMYVTVGGKIDRDITINSDSRSVEFKDAPAEYCDEALFSFVEFLDSVRPNFNKIIKFVDIVQHCIDSKIKEFEGIVVVEEEAQVLVYNSYIGSSGPLDFLYGYFKESKCEEAETLDMSTVEIEEVYYVNGEKCLKHQDSYWNIETGKKVK